MSFGDALASLSTAQKSGRGAPAYSRWVNRPAGRLLAAAAYRMGLSPNHVTAVSAVFTYSAILLLVMVPPSRAASAVVASALLIGYALDSADGQLARLTRMGRPSGEWLDHVIDMGKICLLHGAVAISWFRWGVPGLDAGVWAVAIPVLFLTVSVVGFFGWLLSDLLVRIAQAGQKAELKDRAVQASAPPPSAPVFRSLLRLPGDYGLLALSFAWFASSLFPATYFLLLVANAVILLAALPVWFLQVRAREASP